MKNIKYWLEIAALGIILGLVIQGARAWTEPSAAPPGGNLGAPINTSSVSQTKDGTLMVDFLRWASKGYTDANLTDEPGLVVGGKGQASDFCLNSDPTMCLSGVVDPDAGWKNSLGLDDWPTYVICSYNSGQNFFRLPLSGTNSLNIVSGKKYAVYSIDAGHFRDKDAYEVTGNPGKKAVPNQAALLNCPTQLHLDGRKYECASGITCPTN